MTSPALPFDQVWSEHGRRVVRLVDHLVSRSPQASCLRDDVLSGATEGLWEASLRFDPARGCSLWTYACPVVRGRALDVLRQYDVLPRSARKAQKDGHLLDLWSLEERVDLDEAVLSLASPSDPEGEASRSEEVGRALAAAARLPERQRLVFERILLRDERYRDAAAELGVTECRVSQLASEVAATLRKISNQGASLPTTARSGGKDVLALEHEGRTATVSEWSRAAGLNEGTVRARIRRGLGAAEALSPRHLRGYEAQTLTLRGVSRTVRGWAAHLGWKFSTLQSRLAAGWPVERVLTEVPHRGRRPLCSCVVR